MCGRLVQLNTKIRFNIPENAKKKLHFWRGSQVVVVLNLVICYQQQKGLDLVRVVSSGGLVKQLWVGRTADRSRSVVSGYYGDYN